jgi:ribosomal protein L40E
MALTKFKVCPACGEHNTPALLECKKCETDLTGIKVVDEAILATANASAGEATASSNSRNLVKLCDCGSANPPQARKCSSCGEDISDVRATESQSSSRVTQKVVLRSIDASFTFPLDKPVVVIGREAEMQQYLETKVYVSRKHAKFTLTNDEIYIENMSSTNCTYVNNALIPSDAPTLLKNGDEIGLGGKQINGKRQSQAAYLVIEVAT